MTLRQERYRFTNTLHGSDEKDFRSLECGRRMMRKGEESKPLVQQVKNRGVSDQRLLLFLSFAGTSEDWTLAESERTLREWY